MNHTHAGLPHGTMAGHTAVAALAAVGAIFLLPADVFAEISWLAFPSLTLAFAITLFLVGGRAIARAREDAVERAATDPETGLATPAAADRLLALEFAAAQRGRPLTVVLIRIEQLALYRTRHGAVVTRHLLRLAARTLARHRRGMHLTAHYGTGEGVYLSILSGMEPEGATVYASRLRRDLLSLQGVPEPPPVSMGVARFDMSLRSPSDLLDQAERALARATEAGGKVVVLGQLASETTD